MENPQQTPAPPSDPLLDVLSKHVSDLQQNVENPARAARCRRALELASVLISYANGNVMETRRAVDGELLDVTHVDMFGYGAINPKHLGLPDFLDGRIIAAVPVVSASAQAPTTPCPRPPATRESPKHQLVQEDPTRL